MSEFTMPDYKVKLNDLGHMVGFELAGELYHSEDELAHAASVFSMPDYKVKLDEQGHMIGFELAGELYHHFEDVDDFLEHFGVKGMHWGVRKDADELGVPTKTARTAKKDAEEFTRAKMFYGEGAGTRRKLIKATVEQRMKDPLYKKAFDHYTTRTDLAKRSDQARGERRRKDISNSTRKTARGVKNVLVGNSRNATITALTVAGLGQEAHARGLDKKALNFGKEAVKNVLSYTKHDDFDDDLLAHFSNEELEGFLEETIEHSDLDIDLELFHYGVKGMKWGVRKDRDDGSADSGPISDDHARAVAALTKANAHGLSALSTKEMRDLTQRLEVEKKFNSLASERAKATRSVGRKMIDALLGDLSDVAVSEASNFGKKIARDNIRKQTEKLGSKPPPKPKQVKNLDELIKPYSNRR